ncbi:endonuclease/exonuclease/phosphatase family protein [Bacillus luteolus]|uniref:Endonuclease/exonuclease/phosphatase family protein n=1 Tax=Litchfieldia luteola TaxID=682179 RepID=A0ABR9QKL1_9BACI|nr:endonuclease/exonuclease/phosphatase family protein [Cytobacillus luteolus]MBE4909017.1 endonuclease/exonuclease/phosphatase family protein [Cytobacillus luteolus]MBP1941876.1 maltose 6'-phosphate phosphatase [Cytobacillus luteolus]
MNLLTLNCHSWQEENQVEKIKYLAETVKEKMYDVIALQEVSQLIDDELVTDRMKKSNYAYVLLQELIQLGIKDYSIVWDLSHFAYGKYEEGLAILTKHPVIGEDSFFVSMKNDLHSGKTRKIIGTKLLFHCKPIFVYSCHMGWWHDKIEPFKYQVDKLIENLNMDEHLFLLGDFNNDARLPNEGYEYMLNKGLLDTYQLANKRDEGMTVKGKIAGWSENTRDLRIDLILTNRKLKVEYSRVIFNGVNKNVVSDHYGVEIKCMFED